MPADKDNSIYDLRLLRDGQLAGYAPDARDGGIVKVGPDGSKTYNFYVRIPRDGRKKVTFSAYAYNCDLVKSDTSRVDFTVPGPMQAPATGRAYVISFGVNRYNNPILPDLRYCASDAYSIERDLTQRLAATGKYSEVVGIPLICDGTTKTATGRNLQNILDVLAGKAVKLSELAAIPNHQKLLRANPEDLVVLSFSCHGDSGAGGKFYLFPPPLPSEQTDNSLADLEKNAVSSDDLFLWLRDLDAGQIAMVIDSCHSAASIESGGFRPGPMDSPGLGQLAYDKGMRILAASQAHDVALESDQIGHGLLTWALTHDGLDLGLADNPKDGHITMTKWLQYAANRVPVLYTEARNGGISTDGREVGVKGAILINVDHSTSPDPNNGVQRPSLFDFFKGADDPLISQTPMSQSK